MFAIIVARRSCIQTHSLLSYYIHKKCSAEEKPLSEKDSSFTLSYLINKCGLSHQSALSASNKFNIKTTGNPDSVLQTLKSYDFTEAQITIIITKHPVLLVSNTEKIIKPKLDYYLSLGFSRADLGNFIAKNPKGLSSSLEKRIKPNLKFLGSFLLGNQRIINVINKCNWVLYNNLQPAFLPNIRTLESYGVGHAGITILISLNARVLLQNRERFAKIVQSVRDFGFNPLSYTFAKAVFILSGYNSLTWEKKMGIYKSLGLSQENIIAAFVKQPQCMALSEDKIRRGFEFLSKEIEFDPSFAIVCLNVVRYSLEKRIIPRYSVMRILASKGFEKRYPRSYQFLLISETKFLEKYVTKYKGQVPELLDVFKGKFKSVE